METIEERAYRKSLKKFNPNFCAVPSTRELLIEMATEQRGIDIEKACEWLADPSNDYFPMIKKGWQEAFRKAMEAE